MGIAEGDIDGDGYPKYALTSMGDTKLQKLDTAESGKGRRDRPYPLCRRRPKAFDRLAQRIRRFQQRRPARPVHRQGQCRTNARFCFFRSQQSCAWPMERQVCGFANQFVLVDRTKEQAAYWYPGR
jgi:hypothetical protein